MGNSRRRLRHSDVTAVTNQLYRYAELMDAGDFAGAAQLLANARIKLGEGNWVDARTILALWESGVIRYDDGTPRTKHVTSNVIVEHATDARTIWTRSYYTVFQQVAGTPLQPIIAGRYHDTFERRQGTWRWVERDYSLVDLVGDLRNHLTMTLT